MATGIATIILDVFLHFRLGHRAGVNPWNADTLEWATHTPPNPYNFISLPNCPSRHPMWEHPHLQKTIAEGRHALSVINHGRRETWGTDPLTGEVREIIHLPGNTWLPFLCALALAIVCIALLVRTYLLAGITLIFFFIILLRWSWENGTHPKAAPEAKTMPGDPPLHSRTFDGPGLWGMAMGLLTNGAVYMALLFGWFYLWVVAPFWEMPAKTPLVQMPFIASGILLSAATAWLSLLMRKVRARQVAYLQSNLWGISLVGLAHFGLLLWVLMTADLRPQVTAHDAVISVLLIYQLIQGGVAIVMTSMLALRKAYGYIGKEALYEPVIVEQWWVYTAIVFWVTYVAIILFPMSLGGH